MHLVADVAEQEQPGASRRAGGQVRVGPGALVVPGDAAEDPQVRSPCVSRPARARRRGGGGWAAGAAVRTARGHPFAAPAPGATARSARGPLRDSGSRDVGGLHASMTADGRSRAAAPGEGPSGPGPTRSGLPAHCGRAGTPVAGDGAQRPRRGTRRRLAIPHPIDRSSHDRAAAVRTGHLDPRRSPTHHGRDRGRRAAGRLAPAGAPADRSGQPAARAVRAAHPHPAGRFLAWLEDVDSPAR